MDVRSDPVDREFRSELARSPPFMSGTRRITPSAPATLRITWMYQKATAISPLAMKAAVFVNRPSMTSRPPKVSTTPAAPCSESSSAGWAPNQPSSFCVPMQKNRKPTTMRNRE
jgi:hypothetical protein